jgi:uncharacterized membrane protein
MAFSFKKFWSGLQIVPKTTSTADSKGDLEVIDSTGKLGFHNGTSVSPIVTEDHTATLENKVIVVADNTITTAASGNLAATELNAALAELDADITGHITDTADAHDASAISVSAISGLTATEVQAALAEHQVEIENTYNDLGAHITDAIDAHDASAISSIPSGNLAATEVQAALNELQSDVDTRALDSALTAHITDTVDAHDASAISNVPSGNLAATEVQAALNELQGDIDTINVTSLAAKVTGPASATDEAIARFDGTTGKLVQNSVVTITDAGDAAGLTGLTSSGTVTASGTLSATGSITESFSTDSSTTGANATVSSPTTPVVRLTNAALTSVDLLASPVAGRVITIVNATGNAININNDTGGTAANRILTGTKATLSLADEASIIVKYDSTESRWMIIGGTGAGGGASLDTIFQLIANDVANWSTGDNAAFLGGGTISGTFAADTSTPLQGLASYKYTQAAGSLNDYGASPAQAVDVRFRGQNCTLYFPYTYDGANNDIEVIFYDATNAAIIPSSVFIQAATNVNIFKTNILIPATCASIRVGFMTRVLNSGKIFEFDSVQLTSDTTVMASIGNILSYVDLQGNTISSGGYLRTATVNSPPTKVDYLKYFNIVDDSVNGTRVYAKVAGVYFAEAYNITTASTVTEVLIFAGKGGSEYSIARTRENATSTTLVQEATGSCYLDVGDYIVASNGSSNGGQSTTSLKVSVVAATTNILTAPDTFSTDTAPLVYANAATYTLATLNTAPVGTYITYTYAINTNNRTQTTGVNRPTQTDADMNTNGMLIYTRAYNSASTAASPASFAIQIGKGLKGKSLDLYKSSGKVTAGSIDLCVQSSTTLTGLYYKDYNEVTGILVVDAGVSSPSTVTSRLFEFTDISSQASGYLVVNASKNPALTGLNISAVAARGVNTAGTSIPTGTQTTIVFDATKTYDTNGALVAATGIFTASEAGYYQASGSILFNSSLYAATNLVCVIIQKNGVDYAYGEMTYPGALTIQVNSVISTGVYLIKGDTLTLQVFNNRTAGATLLNTSTGANFFSIHKTSVG